MFFILFYFTETYAAARAKLSRAEDTNSGLGFHKPILKYQRSAKDWK